MPYLIMFDSSRILVSIYLALVYRRERYNDIAYSTS